MNASTLLKMVSRVFQAPMPAIQAAKNPPPYAPGDFAKENSTLLEQTEFYLTMETLWRSEAREAEHPERRMVCIELANAYRRVYDLQTAFYSRWQLSED